ncbi:hypothetical protein Tco_1330630 [Tanacetum coccineum]
MTDAPRTIIQTNQVIEDTHVIITPVNPEGQQQSSSVSSGFVSNMLNLSPDTCIVSIFNLNTESTSLVDILVTTIAKTPLSSAITLHPPTIPIITHLQQTPVPTPITVPISLILGIIDAYLANKMHEAVKKVVQLQSDRLRDEAQAKNADFINKLYDNIKKIIKDQVKEQVKAQVSKILAKFKKTVNEQLEAEVLTRSSNESKTSYAVAANLSELELKKILIDKMESNKSIHRSDEQKNLYKALVDAYESDKLILDTYGDTVTFIRHRDDEDKDKEPSVGSNRGSKRRRAGKEPESTAEEPMHTTKDLEEPTHQDFETGVTKDQPDEETSLLPDCLVEQEYFFKEVYKATTDQLDWNNPEGQQYPHGLRKPLPLIPNSRGHQVIPFDHFINNDLAYLSGGVSSRTYTTLVTKTKAGIYCDVYSKCIIIAVTKLQIVEWHNYKHLDWITVCRDDDKLYKFKEGDFNKLRIQDIEDMLLLLVQGKLTNLTIKGRLAFNNKDKNNKLMRIDELYKFSDGTLNDVRTALNDRLKGIQMKYLPQTIRRQSDRDKVGAMIQAIDKQLKTRRIMRSLEKFVGGKPYEGDFQLL